MRIKDADALRKMMYHEAFETDSDMMKWDSGCWIRYKMFENAFEKAPTIEVEPVKHGRWIDIDPAPWGQVYGTCSECGIRQALDKGKDKFCGVCGTRMDGGEE